MRNQLELRIDLGGLVLSILLTLSYYLSDYFVLTNSLLILFFLYWLNIPLYHYFVRQRSVSVHYLYYIYQFVILNGLLYLTPDHSALLLIVLHLFIFSTRTNFKTTLLWLGYYILGSSLFLISHDYYYQTSYYRWLPFFAGMMSLSVYLGGTLGDYHLRFKELAHIQDSIIRKTTAAIQFIDKMGRNKILNHEAEILYNISSLEALGHYDHELIYNGDKFDEAGNYKSLITETLETGREYEDVEKHVVRKSGETRIYTIQTFRVYDDLNNIIGAMGIYRDITDNKRLSLELEGLNKELSYLTVTDELTELYNYRYFQQRLKEEVEELRESTVLLMIDVDHFKMYNDVHGHQAGDKVLKKVAEVLKHNVRDDDVVVRYGGEEFAVILTGVRLTRGIEVANRLRAAVELNKFVGEEIIPGGDLTISIGVAASINGELSAKELISLADGALYRSKNKGRNQVEVVS